MIDPLCYSFGIHFPTLTRSFIVQSILEDNSGVEVLKKGGLKVLRARVTRNSRLVGQTAVDVRFRENYKAAIVAVQQDGKNATQPLSTLTFGAGDVLVLQVSDDCPLLSPSTATSRKSLLPSLSARSKSPGPLDIEVCKILPHMLLRWLMIGVSSYICN